MQNSDFEKSIKMAASGDNFILKIFLNGSLSKTAAKIYLIIVTKKEIVCIHRSFSYNFQNMSAIVGWSFTEGTDLFRDALGWQWH